MLVSSSLLLLASLSSLASAAHSPSTPRRRHHNHARALAQRDAAPWVCSSITRVGSDQGGLKWVGCEGELPLEEVAVASSSSASSFIPEPTTSSTYEEPAPTTTTQEAAPPVETTQAAAAEDFQQEEAQATTTSATDEAEAQPISSSSTPLPPPTTTTTFDEPTPIPTATSSLLADSTQTQNEPEPIFFETETTSPSSSPEPTTTSPDSSPPPSETSSPNPTPTPEPTTTFVEPAAATETVAPIVNAVASSSTSSDDQSRYLAAHNSFRALYGASALSWSEDAASAAKTWAGRCVFEHSGGSLGSFGENLAAGTGSGYTIESAIKSWTDEAKDYNPFAPNYSHFTQVVWKGTTQVGCAEVDCDGIFDASFGKAKYHVCEYSAPGNVAGQFGTNVGSLA